MKVTSSYPGLTGDALRNAREMAGLRQCDLAFLSFVSPSTVSRMESHGDALILASGTTLFAVTQVLVMSGIAIEENGPVRVGPMAA